MIVRAVADGLSRRHPTRRFATPVGPLLRSRGIVCIALALAACQNNPPVRDRIVEVKVPVATRPIAAKDVPQLPAPLPPRPKDARPALDLALAQVCSFVAYAVRADALLRVSAGLPPMAPPKYPECER